MATRTYYCPECKGEGGFTVNNSIGAYGPDPQCDEHRDCWNCEGRGRLELDPESDDTDGLTPYAPSRRRWLGRRHPAGRDWLEIMATRRAAAASMKRQYPRADIAFTEYGHARLCAMRPKAARLIQCDMLAMAARCVTATEELRRAA